MWSLSGSLSAQARTFCSRSDAIGRPCDRISDRASVFRTATPATACCPCAGGHSTEPVEEIEELGDLFEDLDTVAMHWASAVVPSAGELRHGLLDEQRERRHPPVAQPANRAIDLPQAVRVSTCWRGVASALLQSLDQDLFFEQWRPPPALFAGLNLRGLPQHGIGRSCKVGKEQIVALLIALGLFVGEDIGERNQRCLGRTRSAVRRRPR